MPRKIFPERVFGSRLTAMAILKAATGPILSRTNWKISLVLSADHRAFRDIGMRCQNRFRRWKDGDQRHDDVIGAALT
jgi:hypothetical protein